MKSSLFLYLGFSLAAAGSPQVVERWAAHLDVTPYDQMVGLGLDARGNIYVAGNTAWTNGFGGPDVPLGWLLAKYTPSGSNVWVVRSSADDTAVARGFKVDAEGRCYVTGSIYSGGSEQLFAARYSAGGEREWERRRVATVDASYSRGDSVLADTNGNVWVAGAIITNRAGFIYPVAGLLLQYDPEGNRVKEIVDILPHVVETGGFASLALDPAGALLLRLPAYPTNAGWRAFVVKYSSAGERLWDRETDVIDLSTFGNYPLAGPVADAQGNVFLAGPVLETDFQIKVIKLDTGGNPLWSALYSARHGGGSDVSDLSVDSDGGVVITGDSGTAYIPDDFYVRDIVTLKYGADGAFHWLARGTTPTAPGAGRIVALDGRGNTYVGGEAETFSDAMSPFRGSLVMKFNRLGQRQWLVRQETRPGPGTVAGLALSRRGIILGGSDQVNNPYPVDMHLVKYAEKPDLAYPRFLGRVKVRERGANLVLEARAVGRGRLRYEWFRDGLPVIPRQYGGSTITGTVPAPTGTPMPRQNFRTLTIPNDPASAGEYYVEVSNAHGSVVSEVVRVGLPNLDAVPAAGAERSR